MMNGDPIADGNRAIDQRYSDVALEREGICRPAHLALASAVVAHRPIPFEPGKVAFDGESQVTAKLNRGPSTDFNAMTRTDRCYHRFGRRSLDGPSGFVARADVTVLFLAEGDSLELCSDEQRINMVRYDAVLLDRGTTWKLDAGQGTIFVVDIHYYDDEQDLEDNDVDYDLDDDDEDDERARRE